MQEVGVVTISTAEYMELINKANMHEAYIREVVNLHGNMSMFHRELEEISNRLDALERGNK